MEPEESERQVQELSARDELALLHLARRVVEVVVSGGRSECAGEEWGEALNRRLACFVTLRTRGELRGCIGQLVAREPLWRAVVENAESAATRDHRFAPVTESELEDLEIELSVLSEPEPVKFATPEDLLDRLRPGMDGVVLRLGGRVSTFLPQVWEELADKEEFMEHLSRKAGYEGDAWRGEGVEVSVYQVRHFAER